MRPEELAVVLLLLVSSCFVLQTFGAEDLYWEGEEDASDEFLEVKAEDLGIGGRIKRHVAGLFDFFSPFTTSTSTTEAPDAEVATDDPDTEGFEDVVEDVGSGQPERVEPELVEKTLRVTFVVMEPYQTEFSNRDSTQFQNFSRSLADAVNLLYERLPGTQRASLVRIQSRVSNEFSCKVTLDIVTTGYDDTDRITQVLRDHIRNSRMLGQTVVSDDDFSAHVIDPGLVTCGDDEIRCSDDTCVSGGSRCNGIRDCEDGADEQNCPPNFEYQSNIDQSGTPFDAPRNISCYGFPDLSYVESQRCDGVKDCPRGDDEEGCRGIPETDDTTPYYLPDQGTETPYTEAQRGGPATCSPGEFSCDETRCVRFESRCDGIADCTDGTDEQGCGDKSCGADDFRCSNGKCIEASRRCDRVIDCPNEEDEHHCECGSGEFQCKTDGSCIEGRKRCDGVNHCLDSSDEIDCACSSDQWQCDFGNCIKRNKRCDGRVDCPSDRSDERNCHATGNFRCRNGKFIPDYLRCNRRYDCPPGDYSDEQNCPCGEGDFQCDNGNCIPASKHCDRTHDCQDGSDERDCIYGTVCMAFQYKCSSGQCVPAESLCNGTKECNDWSDEQNCPCKRGEFRCRDGSCINIALRCNGQKECPHGEDELNCAEPSCPPDYFTCPSGSAMKCARRCDGQQECEGGEDEDQCGECNHQCDGACLDDAKICDGQVDCADGTDEADCDFCDGPNDFRCNNGECINAEQYCNGIPECADDSDEQGCNKTMISRPEECTNEEFRCKDGTCINNSFFCDGNRDCNDNSDEENCRCNSDQFQCTSGQCIPSSAYCDGVPNCQDYSDEIDCYSPRPFTTTSNYDLVPTPAPNPRITTQQPRIDDPYWTPSPDADDRYNRRPDDRNTGGYPRPDDRNNGAYPGSDDRNTGRYPDDRNPSGYPDDRNPGYPDDRNPAAYPGSNDRNNAGYPGSSDRNNGGYPGSSGTGNNGYPESGDRNTGSYPSSGDRNTGGYPGSYGTGSGYPSSGDRNTGGYPGSGDRNTGGYPGSGDRNTGGYPSSGGSNTGSYPGSSGTSNGGYPSSGDRNTGGYPGSGDRNSGGYPSSAEGNNGGYPDSTDRNNGGYPGSSGGYPGADDRNTGGYPSSADRNTGGYSGPDNRNYVGASLIHRYPPQQDGCRLGEWRCENGPCIRAYARCDGRVDCPFDSSDELDCPAGSPVALNLKSYPSEQSIRNGGDVVFQCRDEGPQRAIVKWVREDGQPLKAGSTDVKGRLDMYQVTTADRGTYICRAVDYVGYPGSEIKVTLQVDPTPVTMKPPNIGCLPHEATCGNGQCIPKSAVCNNVVDCADRTDEDNCFVNGKCEPNQFKCSNNKCILKTWRCDSDDDCGDGSDEVDCGYVAPGQCRPSEFTCASQTQCVPKSFHCDGRPDCDDRSDEVGCAPVYVTSPPKPANLLLNVGDTLVLNCSATGVPTPIITWRRNWGDVPESCTMENVNSFAQTIGTLTCPNMLPEHNGAYSCEAMNNKGTIFAVPDAIVFVNQSSVCPSGYFNSEARSERECIRCFCFGESTQCHSADLFTYNMPTPLGEGGTRLVGVKNAANGEVQLDTQPITEQYYYQPLQRNGVSVTKLARFNNGWGWSSALPYLTLPETYNGNQLTSYGGHIKYRVTPHNYGPDASGPDVIIKGKYQNLVHFNRGGQTLLEARLTPENWQKPTQRGLMPATREDIMMALDDIEMILLRASVNNAGVNITDFVMESAKHINMGLGVASLVEECVCPPGYEGLSCQKCASGYVRESSGPWLGNCVRERPICPAGTYGDPDSGYACRPCPCPLTNRENQFASSCSLRANGEVVCDCAPGYEGANCESCAPGYVGNPLIPGDSCKPKPTSSCNPVGTSHERFPDECVCKDNVQGKYCDQCNNESFYLSPDFRQGCALCFCSGITQQCSSSNLRRTTTTVLFNTPNIVNQVRVYNSAPAGPDSARYNVPKETNLTAVLAGGEVLLADFDRSRPNIYYWSLPVNFAGDKVTSYGGYLKYTLRRVPFSGGKNNAADVQLISDNGLTFHYFGNFEPQFDGTLEASVQFLEKGWQRSDGKEVTREHFLLALADVKALLVKATYSSNSQMASLVSASIDTAEPNGNGPPALHVEQCVCPRGYIGTSCEDCAPGFTRYESGIYLELCGPCECNGHSNMCHPETGVCTNCQDNTDGEHCENCKPGYRRDRANNCVPEYNQPSEPSPPENLCDPRGSVDPYPRSGYCECKQNVEGPKCDTCRRGTFGLDGNYSLGCYDCYCSGVTTDCYEASSQYYRVPMAAPIFGDDYGGYKLMDVTGERVLNDPIVSMPLNSELMYVFTFPPDEELYWSLPLFPGNRVLSYGGTLQLKQKYESRSDFVSEPGTDVILVGDDVSVFWTNPQSIQVGEPLSYQVPLTERGWFLLNSATPASRSDFMSVLRNLQRVLVRATLVRNIESSSIADVAMDTASEQPGNPFSPRATATEVCMCPEGYSGTSCESCATSHYRDEYRQCQRCPCSGHDCYLATDGQVVCNCRPPYSGRDCSTIGGESSKVTSTTQGPAPPRSTVVVYITSPTIKIQEVGSSVNFTCQAQSRVNRGVLPITWSKEDGYLPQGRTIIDNQQGMLLITNLQVSDSGKYICQTSDGISTAQSYATLKVPGSDMTLPTVDIQPPVKEYFEGDRVQLECVTSGNPAPQITWQRASGRPLPVSVEIIEDLLIIENVREEDSGEYRCIASNTLGATDRTAIVNVRPRPVAPPRDKLTVSQNTPSVAEGQNTRITCTGTANVPAGTIDWVREDGTELQSNVRSVNGVLYIDLAKLDNQGVYVCQTTSYDVQPVRVVVTVIPQGTPSPDDQPNITVSVDMLRIPTGGSGSVDCTPRGYPPPQITWTKHDGRFGNGVSQRQNSLIIRDATEDDKGYYLCQGLVDGTPVVNSYVYVDVEKREEPQIEIFPQGEQAVTLGSPFELRCRVRAGVPEPDVTWSRNGGRPLSPHAQIQPNNILKFERIEVNDEGEYSCSASNVAGTATASATIKVRSPPQVTITPNEYVVAVYGDPVTVECRASGYPLPMVSIKTIPEMREIVPASEGRAVLQLPSVNDRDDGEYICSATSPAGTIEEHFAIRVDRGDGGYGGDEGSGEDSINTDYHGYPYDQVPNDLIADEGQVTRIGCNVSNDAYEVRWTRIGEPLQSNAEQIGTELVIRNTSKADSGYYTCNLYDRYSRELQRSVVTNLRVLAPPRITLQPPTQTVRPGESPTVECVVEGDEILNVTWRAVTRPFSSRVEINRSRLIFHRIEVEDAGDYECYAENRIANNKATAEVIVSVDTDRAKESHENEQYAHVGAAVQLSCATQAQYRVRWTKDGRALPGSVVQRPDGSLYIRHAQKSDSGHYLCVIHDQYGRNTSNYINLHIDGEECSDTEFRCYDNSRCIDVDWLCDGINDCPDESDERNCILREKRVRVRDRRTDNQDGASMSPREEPPALVSIDQPRSPFRVGEDVQVLCRARSREDRVSWSRYGTNQYVESMNYGDGAMLVVRSVQESDAGVYRCTGQDPYGRTSYEDFNLEVQPGTSVMYPENPADEVATFTARLGDDVDMPCTHNLEQPASVEWRREYTPLQPDVRPYEPNLHLQRITESDAGMYVCRVSNSRTAVERRAILRVMGVVPRFDGSGWIALPTLKDAYHQFDIEISFKPTDGNGLILFSSDKQDRTGKFLALQLLDGVPQFMLDVGDGPLTVNGDRPLQLNTWHTIRISKTNARVMMDVDNNGPSSVLSTGTGLLELAEPLYIGGVRDLDQLPAALAGAAGFMGCVSMLILGREEKNIMLDSIGQSNVLQCDSCYPNLCNNNGVCQEARNERGYVCICTPGFAGLNCDRTGEACRPGLCGPGKCSDTADGYKCACPVTYTGKNCDVKQSIEYPAFTGSAYLAVKAPKLSRFFQMSMNVKATAPVSDGIIMYCAESPRGYRGFIALTVHNSRLEFIYDLGDGSGPVVVTSNRTLQANEWTNVNIRRVGPSISMIVNSIHSYEKKLESVKTDLNLETPLFVGGVDDSIVLNKNTGVTGGFNGCIKDVTVFRNALNIVGSSIQSANVQECSNYDRGDIPEVENICSQCRNGGECSSDGASCVCPMGFAGRLCETRVPLTARRPPGDPCAAQPCRNGGSCRPDFSTRMNYTCDCPLGFAGANCQMQLELFQSVGFNGNGYLELPAQMLNYENLDREPAEIVMAFSTKEDGVLLFQREGQQPINYDFILLRVENGVVVLTWNLGSGESSLSVEEKFVADGDRHTVIARISEYYVSLTVDGVVRNGTSAGFSNRVDTNSNIYIGGIPSAYNVNAYRGLNGCVEQVELMGSDRGIDLGRTAVAARNTQRCRNAMFLDVYPFFEEIEMFQSPPPRYHHNANPSRLCPTVCLLIITSLYLLHFN